MSDPSDVTNTPPPMASGDGGKTTAAIVYLLFLLSLPSIGLLMLVGAVVAYVARDTAAPWVRSHMDKEIRTFWTTLWWTVGLVILGVVSVPLMFVLIGFPMMWAAWIGGVILAIWFHVVSFFGLLRLMQDQPA